MVERADRRCPVYPLLLDFRARGQPAAAAPVPRSNFVAWSMPYAAPSKCRMAWMRRLRLTPRQCAHACCVRRNGHG